MAHRGSSQGYLFLRVDKDKSIVPDSATTYQNYETNLKKDLGAIGIAKWYLYGTHSFRRGGAQYYLNVCGKSIEQIRAWGRWRGAAIYRYLMDHHTFGGQSRHDFTKP
jgi:hypothetical protein